MAADSEERARIVDFTDLHRAREENYRALHTNAFHSFISAR